MSFFKKLFRTSKKKKSQKHKTQANSSNYKYKPGDQEKFLADLHQEWYDKNMYGYRDRQDALAYQNALLDRVNTAQQKYKEDGDIEAVIKELEYAFIEADPPCQSSQYLDLINYYIKANKNDKAWAYLNRLLMKNEAPLKDIRFSQARILKKEKKWMYAIEMYMLGYLAKSQWNNNFQRDMFIKDIKSSANKLSWDDTVIDSLAQMVATQVQKKKYDEDELIKKYRDFCSSLQSN